LESKCFNHYIINFGHYSFLPERTCARPLLEGVKHFVRVIEHVLHTDV